MLPPELAGLFDTMAAERRDGSIVLPFPIWREAFINDADLETAERAYRVLNPHPVRTLTDKITLKRNPAEMTMGKSYVNCTEDTSLPHQYPWHPRLSQKLGLFRLIQVGGQPRALLLEPGASRSRSDGCGARLSTEPDLSPIGPLHTVTCP